MFLSVVIIFHLWTLVGRLSMIDQVTKVTLGPGILAILPQEKNKKNTK